MSVLVAMSLFVLTGCTRMQETQRDDLIGIWSYSADESTVGSSVLAATVDLRAEGTVRVENFPAAQMTKKDFAKDPISDTGTWEFLAELPEGWARYKNQSGVELKIASPRSVAGTKQLVRLVIERYADEAPVLLFYVGFPDILDEHYVLTKQN
ncbi:hypothetical protein [Arthrobacter sp. 9V]|uniref:hypothetical protein n=1 Tax=Arthrobacter sp. 9V TaxID=2653132 RepID=UPI00135698D6|nr:hypothetical protein [Arthrobacter sp. 9V]